MACKQEASIVRVDGFPNETPEKKSGDQLTKHVENVVRTWALVKKDLVGNGITFYVRSVPDVFHLESAPSFTVDSVISYLFTRSSDHLLVILTRPLGRTDRAIHYR